MKLLMTGAAGSVGSALRAELDKDHRVITLGKTAGGDIDYVFDLAEQPVELRALIEKEKPDVIIHLASLVGGACEAEPDVAERVNVDATRWLADLSVQTGVKRFIFFSTAAVYAQTELAPTDELSNIAPQSVYGKTKLQAEQEISSLAMSAHDVQFVSLRPFNIYGPAFANSLVYRLIHSSPSEPVQLFGFNNFYRDYVHISDVTRATQLALTHDFADRHAILNVGSGVATNNAQLVDALTRAGIKPAYTTGDTDEQTISWADISRARQMGYNPTPSIVIDA